MYVSKTIQSCMIHTCTFLRASPSIKLITGTDPYVAYCIPHADQYHAHKNIMSVVAVSGKAVVIKILGVKDPTKSRALFCAHVINNVT